MTDIIQLLPDSVANQIAAGEVIQRPASVVKELVENAVDAGSNRISVIVKDAGKTLIQIIDNGRGMSDTDARLAFERHATSKIRTANDLFEIQTMGFRGEALASIAAVAHVTVKTRLSDEETGTQIIISGSNLEKQETVSCPQGTNISVKNLFYNVPARRKFLKSTTTELRHIVDEFQRIALANADIEFKLVHNENEVLNLPVVNNLKQRIIHVFGKSINSSLNALEVNTSIVDIKGFIGKPENAKKKFGEQFFFINNRYMRHPYLHKAIMTAYDQILPAGYIPSYFLYLKANPKTIDINIHPTKTEIKFEDEQAIFQIIQAAAKQCLGKSNVIPSIDFDNESSIEIPVIDKKAEIQPPEIKVNQEYNPFTANKEKDGGYKSKSTAPKIKTEDWEKFYAGFNNQKEHPESFQELDSEKQDIIKINQLQHSPEYIQLKGKFIVTPVKSGLMLIDQKRAHERIIYEQMIHALAVNGSIAQQALFPETIELNINDYNVLQEIIDDLHSIGFDISDFGNNTIAINGCPADIKNPQPKELLESIIEDFNNGKNDLKRNRKEQLASSYASAATIQYGSKLSAHEMQELIDTLFACEDHNFTPSGKKILSIIPIDSLEHGFK